MNRFIDERALVPAALNPAQFEYHQKVHLALALGLPEYLKGALLFIGTTRNACAHNLEFTLDKNRVNNFYKSFSPELKEMFHKTYASAQQHSVDTEDVKLSDFKNYEPSLRFSLLIAFLKALLAIADRHGFPVAEREMSGIKAH